MNKVILIGRLTRDPEVRISGDGSLTITRFSIAVDRRFKRDDGVNADFPNCVAFGKTAEFIEKYFNKGKKIGITGRLQTGRYTNKDGVDVYTTDIIVEEAEFVESKGADTGNAGGGRAPVDDDGFMSIPDGIDEELPFN
jgi:single-strand DNA-binding protein